MTTMDSRSERRLKEPPILMDLKAAAEHAGMSKWTLRDLVLCGRIRRVRIPGREGYPLRRIWVRRTDLEAYLEGQCDATTCSFADSHVTDWPVSRRKQARRKLESDAQSGVPAGVARFWQPVQATSGSLA